MNRYFTDGGPRGDVRAGRASSDPISQHFTARPSGRHMEEGCRLLYEHPAPHGLSNVETYFENGVLRDGMVAVDQFCQPLGASVIHVVGCHHIVVVYKLGLDKPLG